MTKCSIRCEPSLNSCIRSVRHRLAPVRKGAVPRLLSFLGCVEAKARCYAALGAGSSSKYARTDVSTALLIASDIWCMSGINVLTSMNKSRSCSRPAMVFSRIDASTKAWESCIPADVAKLHDRQPLSLPLCSFSQDDFRCGQRFPRASFQLHAPINLFSG